MKIKKRKKEKTHQISPIIVIIINIIIIFSIISVLNDFQNKNSNIVEAYSKPRIKENPNNFTSINYETLESALTETNNQLQNMTIGNIKTINGSQDDFYGAFYRDYEIGDILYWDFGDNETQIQIDAITGEILFYDTTGWIVGSLNSTQVENQASLIANQFSLLPSDRVGPECDFLNDPPLLTGIAVDIDTLNDTVEEYTYWQVIWNRSKNGIKSEDNIRLLLLPNGYCSLYLKVWNMDLNSLSTSYTVTKTSAEQTATTYVGSNSTVQESEKKIVRPNNLWTPNDLSFGLDAVCVWEVIIECDSHLYIIHVDGNDNTIVGGNFAYNYYYEE